MPKPTCIACTNCTAAAELPDDRDHSGLWDAGWRWIGSQDLFSCPACQPVIVVDARGKHTRGPGARTPMASTEK